LEGIGIPVAECEEGVRFNGGVIGTAEKLDVASQGGIARTGREKLRAGYLKALVDIYFEHGIDQAAGTARDKSKHWEYDKASYRCVKKSAIVRQDSKTICDLVQFLNGSRIAATQN
jgi:hypothetical protein